MKARHEFTSDAAWLEYQRTYFAAMAMQGMVSNSMGDIQGVKPYSLMTYSEIANDAVMAANALITALNADNGK